MVDSVDIFVHRCVQARAPCVFVSVRPQNVSQSLLGLENYVLSVILYSLSNLCTYYLCVITVFGLRQTFFFFYEVLQIITLIWGCIVICSDTSLAVDSRILRNFQIAAFCISMSYFMESKLKKISIDSW